MSSICEPGPGRHCWVVSETGESFDNYPAYVERLLDLRCPKTDLVLTAHGTIVYPTSDKPDRPEIAKSDYNIVTFDISPDQALRRLGGCEFQATGLTTSDRVYRLQQEVDALLAQATDEKFGAEIVGDLRRLRSDLHRLSDPRFRSVTDRSERSDSEDSILNLHERVSRLEKALEVSALSDADTLLDELEDRVSLLSESKLEQIAVKSRQALIDMQLLSQQTSSCVNRAAFDELHDAVARWDDIASAIPQIIHRLITIKDLHEQGVDIVNRVTALEQMVEIGNAKLKQSESAVVNIERTLADNLKVMKANCTALSQRLDRLEQSRHSDCS